MTKSSTTVGTLCSSSNNINVNVPVNTEGKQKAHHPLQLGNVYLFKILLIGDSQSGKTSLSQKFGHNEFDSQYIPTIGVDFKTKNFEIKNKTASTVEEKKLVRLQLWDSSGDDRYKTVTGCYYRGAHGIIVSCDLTNKDSLETAQRWLQHTELFASSSACRILVGTKSDLKDQREISSEALQEFASKYNLSYIETSAKTGENVSEVFNTLSNEIIESYQIPEEATQAKSQDSKASAKEKQKKGAFACCNFWAGISLVQNLWSSSVAVYDPRATNNASTQESPYSVETAKMSVTTQ